MTTITLYPLNKAAKKLGLNRNLVTFLVNDRDIPTVDIGSAKALDEDGLKLLEEAAREYLAKASA